MIVWAADHSGLPDNELAGHQAKLGATMITRQRTR